MKKQVSTYTITWILFIVCSILVVLALYLKIDILAGFFGALAVVLLLFQSSNIYTD